MAELIKKTELIEALVLSHTAHANNSREASLLNRDVRIVMEQPVTTEAEIRAKAISDFLQFVYDNASNEEYANEDGWAFSDLMDLEYKFAEQLKECD